MWGNDKYRGLDELEATNVSPSDGSSGNWYQLGTTS